MHPSLRPRTLLLALSCALFLTAAALPPTAIAGASLRGEYFRISSGTYASVANDGAAWNGQYMGLWGNGSVHTGYRGSISKIVVRVRGTECGTNSEISAGTSWPYMTLYVNGVAVYRSYVRTSRTHYNFSYHTVYVNRRYGTHSMKVGFSNDKSSIFCTRDLHFDHMTIS